MNFDDRFRLVYPLIKRIAKKYANTTNVPEEEFESLLCEEFISIDKSYRKSSNNSYRAYVGSMLDGKAKRMTNPNRKERKFYDSIMYIDPPDQEDESADYASEIVADVDVEQSVFDVMFVEEQLAKADEVTRKILVEFFADPSVSFREIGRKLGIHDMTVKSKLAKVAEAVRQA